MILVVNFYKIVRQKLRIQIYKRFESYEKFSKMYLAFNLHSFL